MSAVVVVGTGALGPSGYGADAIASSNGRRTIEGFDAADYLRLRGLRPLSRASLLACVAAAAALDHPAEPFAEPERRAVVLGTRWASIDPLFEFERSSALDGPSLVNPSHFPNVVVNAHAGYLGILFGLAGPSVTLCGPGTALESIGVGADLLGLGRADTVLCGGVEALGEAVLRGLERSGADGGAEGAAFLLLAREGEGVEGSARVASSVSAPAAGRDAVIGRALEIAGLEPERIGTVWLAGGDTALADGLPAPRRLGSGAAGAIVAVAAAHAVARTGAPALGAFLPAEGTQSAVVFGTCGASAV